MRTVVFSIYILAKFIATAKGMDPMKRHYTGHMNELQTSIQIMQSVNFNTKNPACIILKTE